MDWLFYSILATGLFTAYSLLGRVLAVKTVNPRAFAVIYNAIVAVIAVLFFVSQPYTIRPIPLNVLFFTILAMLTWGGFGRMEFFARKMVDASTMTIIFRLAYAVTFLLSIIIFKESVTGLKILALLLIVAANALIFLRNDKFKMSKDLLIPFAVATALGMGWTFDKAVSSYYPLFLYVVISFSFPSIFSLVTPPLSKAVLLTEIKTTSWKIVLLALINFFAYYVFLKAIGTGEISRVILITSSSEIMTILLGIWLLKERAMVKEKIFAGVLVFISVILLR